MNTAELLIERFFVRTDVYARQLSEGYTPVRDAGGSNVPLSVQVVKNHLAGTVCLGSYAVESEAAAAKWVAIDIDGMYEDPEAARGATRALAHTCLHFALAPLVEWTGKKGWRIWLFTERIPAALARDIGLGIVAEAGPEALEGTSEVAVFPKQATLDANDPTALGNLVKLPWGKRADNGVRSEFRSLRKLRPLPQAAQLAWLQKAAVYGADELRELARDNGWEGLGAHSLPDASGKGGLLRRTAYGGLPCYEQIIGPEFRGLIPEGRRNNVLFAFCSQHKRKGSSEAVALRDLLHLNAERCRPPLAERALRQMVASSYRSDSSSAHCDVLQKADLCPVISVGIFCPIYEKRTAIHAAQVDAVQEAADVICITPITVSRGDPPTYTITIAGQPLRLKSVELFSWRTVQLRAMEALNFIPTLPPVYEEADGKRKRLPAGAQWLPMLNEALKTLQEEEAPPEDASPRGAVWQGVRAFLTEGKVSESRDRLAKGDVVLENDHYLFRGRDLRQWLKLTGGDRLEEHDLWLLIRDHGGTNGVTYAGGTNVRVWRVPIASVRTDESEREAVDSTPPALSVSDLFQARNE